MSKIYKYSEFLKDDDGNKIIPKDIQRGDSIEITIEEWQYFCENPFALLHLINICSWATYDHGTDRFQLFFSYKRERKHLQSVVTTFCNRIIFT